MKKTLLLVIFTGIFFSAMAQTEATQDTSNCKVKVTGIMGGPIVSSLQSNNQFMALIGGKGGIIWENKIAFGFYGHGMVGAINQHNYNSSNSVDTTETNLGYGGFFVEYLFKPKSTVHFTIPLYFGLGGLKVETPGNARLEGSQLWVLEPCFNLEVNITRYLRFGINTGYRFVKMNKLEYVNINDFNGVRYGISFRFGNYE